MTKLYQSQIRWAGPIAWNVSAALGRPRTAVVLGVSWRWAGRARALTFGWESTPFLLLPAWTDAPTRAALVGWSFLFLGIFLDYRMRPLRGPGITT